MEYITTNAINYSVREIDHKNGNYRSYTGCMNEVNVACNWIWREIICN